MGELHSAIRRDDEKGIRQLIKSGFNLEEKNSRGKTPLMMAAIRGRDRIVRILIESGAQLDTKSNGGKTALMFACEEGFFKVVKMLLLAGADSKIKDNNGRTALLLTAEAKHMSNAKKMKEEKVGDITYFGYHEMHKRSHVQYRKILRLLVANGADINEMNSNGETALMVACQREHFNLVKEIISLGCDIELEDNRGYTAMFIANKTRNAKIINLLRNNVKNNV